MTHHMLVLALVCVVNTAVATAQVNVTGQDSEDKSASTRQITVSTMDRSFVPLTIENKQTQVNADTTRTESTTRARLNDGGYFDWRSSVSVQRQIDANRTETMQDVVEKDRQGGTRTVLQIKQETSKTPDGEQSKASQYRRNSSGAMTLDRVTTAATATNPDGSRTTTTAEEVRDVDGKLQPGRQTLATAIPLSATETQITTQVRQFNHIAGNFGVVGRDTATVSTIDNATRTERLIQQPDGAGWRDVGRVVTTETRQPDGTVLRETLEEGQSLYSKTSPTTVEPLQPTRKIVEREVHNADGTVVIQSEVLRRDVNGGWKPQTFSTETAPAQQAGY